MVITGTTYLQTSQYHGRLVQFSTEGLGETQRTWNQFLHALHSIMLVPSTLGMRQVQCTGMHCAALIVTFLLVCLTGNIVKQPSSKHLMRWGRILLSSKRSFAGDVPRQSAVAYAIAYTPQSLPFVCMLTLANFSVMASSFVWRRAAICCWSMSGAIECMLSYTSTSGCSAPIVLMVTQWSLPLWRIWMN